MGRIHTVKVRWRFPECTSEWMHVEVQLECLSKCTKTAPSHFNMGSNWVWREVVTILSIGRPGGTTSIWLARTNPSNDSGSSKRELLLLTVSLASGSETDRPDPSVWDGPWLHLRSCNWIWGFSTILAIVKWFLFVCMHKLTFLKLIECELNQTCLRA